MEDVIIDSGSLISTGEYSQFQNVIINTTLTISRPADVTILGKLTVNPGVTLYVADNATLTIGASGIAADLDVQGTLESSPMEHLQSRLENSPSEQDPTSTSTEQLHSMQLTLPSPIREPSLSARPPLVERRTLSSTSFPQEQSSMSIP